MEYIINPVAFSSAFTLPGEIADRHLKLASATQLKVILFVFRHLSDAKNSQEIADGLGLKQNEVDDALLYWQSAGILMPKNTQPQPESSVEKTPKTAKKATIEMPTRQDVARRSVDDSRFAFLLQESQVKFGRLLKDNESRVLLWLYEDEGMEVSLILMLLEYAISENKCTLSFIQRTAVEWLNNGIETISDAESYITKLYKKKTAWKIVEAAFGIEERMPSSKELEYSDKWINEWGFDRQILRLAYEICVDTKSKFSMPYVAKVLESWHQSGVKTEQEAKLKIASKKTNGETGFGHTAEELSLIEQMINKGYGEN